MTVIFLVIVPMISIIHWLTIVAQYGVAGDENLLLLRAWITTYPLIGLANIGDYLTFVKPVAIN